MRSSFLAVSALLAAPLLASAEGAAYKFDRAIYFDEKEAPLKAPEGVACADSSVVVADTGNGRLLLFGFRDGTLGAGAELKIPQLPYPVRLQIDRQGDLLVLDRKARKIGKVDARRTFAGWLEPKGVADGSAVNPVAFKLDAADNVFLLDVAGSRVLVLEPGGKVKREIPLPRSGAFTDVAVDGSDRVYVADGAAARIWVAEKGASSFQPFTPEMRDRMSFPGYVYVDRGRLLVVDQNGMGVVILGMDGTYQSRELSLGWSAGNVLYPAQICLTPSGDAFLADRQNHRVQVFTVRR